MSTKFKLSTSFSLLNADIGQGESSLYPDNFRNLMQTSLSKDTSLVKKFYEHPISVSRDVSQSVTNTLSCNVEKSFKSSWIKIQKWMTSKT